MSFFKNIQLRSLFLRGGGLAMGVLTGLTLFMVPTNGRAEDLALTYKAYGSGQTTGHVATLEITNPGEEGRLVSLKPFLIPPTERYQGYVVPTSTHIEVRGGSKVILLLQGFCTDIRRPPVPEGQPMSHPGEWIEPSPPSPLDELKVTEDGPYRKADSRPKGATIPTVPGSTREFPIKININRYPEAAAPFLVEAITLIGETYDWLAANGRIETPFSGNPDKERESVVQQAFWIYTAALQDMPYSKEDFTGRLRKMHEGHSGDAPAAETPGDEQVVKQADDFWTIFNMVGTEAKVFRKSELPKN